MRPAAGFRTQRVPLFLYLTRQTWIQYLPRNPLPYPLNFRYDPLGPETPSESFTDDVRLGFSSNSFSLAGNIESGDSRSGLDDTAKQEIKQIMKKRGVGFDEARRQVVQERFRKQGIGPDGRPKDPKFVSFS
ncbi:MAG: hypothetical protein Q9159_006570 [Coniocarpon cinnabarinum]